MRKFIYIIALLGFSAAATIISTWLFGSGIVGGNTYAVINIVSMTALAIAGAAYHANK